MAAFFVALAVATVTAATVTRDSILDLLKQVFVLLLVLTALLSLAVTLGDTSSCLVSMAKAEAVIMAVVLATTTISLLHKVRMGSRFCQTMASMVCLGFAVAVGVSLGRCMVGIRLGLGSAMALGLIMVVSSNPACQLRHLLAQ